MRKGSVVPSSIEMVKLDRIDELCPDDLWARSAELDKVITTQIVESGDLDLAVLALSGLRRRQPG